MLRELHPKCNGSHNNKIENYDSSLSSVGTLGFSEATGPDIESSGGRFALVGWKEGDSAGEEMLRNNQNLSLEQSAYFIFTWA